MEKSLYNGETINHLTNMCLSTFYTCIVVWMAQILLIQHRSELDMVQNYTQLTPISQVKNTKTKRIMKRITRNAIIMICPFRLAFFMTIATLFCIQTKEGVLLLSFIQSQTETG